MQDRIYSLVVEQNDVSWKSIIQDLIRTEQMDPWDIDVSLLTQRYIETIKNLESADLKLGGKVLLAAALLLKIKSRKLLSDDLDDFDRILAGKEVTQEEFYDDLERELAQGEIAAMKEEVPELQPHLPLPRQRKVSVYDLVRALEKALEVKRRRILRNPPAEPVEAPEKKFDINAAIQRIYHRVLALLSSRQFLTFDELLQFPTRKERVYTFIPLLHLAMHRKLDLVQEKPFGEVHIRIPEVHNEG